MRCGKVLWNVGRFSWDGFANRQRKTDTGIVQVKREQMLWETSKAPWRTCLGSESTKPLISKYKPLEGSSKAEAKGMLEAVRH